jgi:hypothetical protein
LDPNLSDELASGQAKRFIDGRLGQLKQQVQQAERARSLTLGQRRFSGTGVALMLALATAAVAMAAKEFFMLIAVKSYSFRCISVSSERRQQ